MLTKFDYFSQLCATKNCRETVRNNNIYVILREYHKWESNPECLIICEDLVNILIRYAVFAHFRVFQCSPNGIVSVIFFLIEGYLIFLFVYSKHFFFRCQD